MVSLDLNTYNPLTDNNGFNDIDFVQLNKYDVLINHMDVIPLTDNKSIDLIDFLDLFNDNDIDMIVFKNSQILTLKRLLKTVFKKIDNNTLININNDINDIDNHIYNQYDMDDIMSGLTFTNIIDKLSSDMDINSFIDDDDRFYFNGHGRIEKIHLMDIDDVIDKSYLINMIINDKTLLKYVIFNI